MRLKLNKSFDSINNVTEYISYILSLYDRIMNYYTWFTCFGWLMAHLLRIFLNRLDRLLG